ncbi:hypothetical protein FKM82_009383 [Ascaphus truei]
MQRGHSLYGDIVVLSKDILFVDLEICQLFFLEQTKVRERAHVSGFSAIFLFHALIALATGSPGPPIKQSRALMRCRSMYISDHPCG